MSLCYPRSSHSFIQNSPVGYSVHSKWRPKSLQCSQRPTWPPPCPRQQPATSLMVTCYRLHLDHSTQALVASLPLPPPEMLFMQIATGLLLNFPRDLAKMWLYQWPSLYPTVFLHISDHHVPHHTCYLVSLPLHTRRFCICRFNQPWTENIWKTKFRASSKKQTLNLRCTSNYLHSVYTGFTTIYIALILY